MKTTTLSTLLFLSLAGCIDQDPNLAIDEAEIINGDEMNAENSGLPMIQNGGGICSGQLLDNEWVLTAAHCVDPYNDHAFDGDGQAMVTFAGYKSQVAKAVASDSVGRAVVAGTVWDGTTNYFAVARVRSNGTPDPYFASGSGRVTAGFPGITRVGVSGVAIDSQQRIVVAGYANTVGGNVIAVMRFTPAGQLDTTFSGDGRLLHTVPDSSNEEGTSVAIDSQNRVIVGGSAQVNGQRKWLVTRYTATGGLDSTWGGAGSIITDIYSTDQESLAGIAVDGNGRIVATGHADDYLAVVRWMYTGALDTSLDSDGKVIVKYGNARTAGNALAIDSQNRIVVTGEGDATNGMLVARFTTAGALDSSFDGNGWTALTPRFTYTDGDGLAIAIDKQNRIVVAGTVRDADYINAYAVGRLTGSGALDVQFNTLGRVIDSYANDTNASYEAFGNGIAVDPSGNLFVSFESDGLSSATGVFGVAHLMSEVWNVPAWQSLRVQMGTQMVGTSRVFLHSSLDAAMIKLASPLQINGSTTGFEFRGFYTPAPSTLVGKTLRCYGYGRYTLTSGAGTLRAASLAVTSATAPEYTLNKNADDQALYRGDSGGPCYVATATGPQVAGITSWGNAERMQQLAASAFGDWANAIRVWY